MIGGKNESQLFLYHRRSDTRNVKKPLTCQSFLRKTSVGLPCIAADWGRTNLVINCILNIPFETFILSQIGETMRRTQRDFKERS